MKYYDVYFEIYGKKLKTHVVAKNENEAKEFIKNKIVFHKIIGKDIGTKENNFDSKDFFKDLFDTFKTK